MIRFLLGILFVLIGMSCGSDDDTEIVKTNPRFTLEVKEAFTVVEDGINNGTVLISNRGDSELHFDFENKSTFELKKDDALAPEIAVMVESKNLALPPGESQILQISLEGLRSDTGAFSLTIFAAELNAEEEPISATIFFDAVFDPEEISPVQARRCENDTLSQQRENEFEVLYGLDGYFCFDLKRGDASIKTISVKVTSPSSNLIGLNEVNEKYSTLSFADVETHRIEIPFSLFTTSTPEDKIILSVEVEGMDAQTYTIKPRPVVNSLWFIFAELRSVPELEAIQDTLVDVSDSTLKKFTSVIINLFLYRRERLDDDESEKQKSRVNNAQSFLEDIKRENKNIIDEDIYLMMKALADSYTASIKKANGGGDFIESSIKLFKESIIVTPNDWMLRYVRGIVVLGMGRGIKDDFLGNLVYGDDANGWIIAAEKDLNIVIDAHEFASTEILDWSLYNYIQEPVPDEILMRAVKLLNE